MTVTVEHIDPIARLESFRGLTLSRLENFILKTLMEDFLCGLFFNFYSVGKSLDLIKTFEGGRVAQAQG